MIAFSIKYSIDNSCRGDAVFDAKTDERAQHHAHDFGAKQIPSGFSGGPKWFKLADEGAWNLFSKYLAAEAGGYFAPPAKEEWPIRNSSLMSGYYSTRKKRHFVEEVTRVTWAKQQEESVRQDIRPAFSA